MSSAYSAILIEILPHVLLEAADDLTEQDAHTIDLALESVDARLDRRRTLGVLRDLALLVEIPEESHRSASVE
jgi:hypothetical protein